MEVSFGEDSDKTSETAVVVSILPNSQTSQKTTSRPAASALREPTPKSSGTANGENLPAKTNPPRAKQPSVNVRSRGTRFGLAQWMRLVRSSTDLAQRKGEAYRKDITWEEIRKHNQPHDGWMVLRGVVYNIGPYLPYHPGGVEIFSKAKLLGADGTKAFDKYHPWVSIEGLIETLAIGSVAFIPDIEDVRESDEDDEDEDDTVGNTIATKA